MEQPALAVSFSSEQLANCAHDYLKSSVGPVEMRVAVTDEHPARVVAAFYSDVIGAGEMWSRVEECVDGSSEGHRISVDTAMASLGGRATEPVPAGFASTLIDAMGGNGPFTTTQISAAFAAHDLTEWVEVGDAGGDRRTTAAGHIKPLDWSDPDQRAALIDVAGFVVEQWREPSSGILGQPGMLLEQSIQRQQRNSGARQLDELTPFDRGPDFVVAYTDAGGPGFASRALHGAFPFVSVHSKPFAFRGREWTVSGIWCEDESWNSIIDTISQAMPDQIEAHIAPEALALAAYPPNPAVPETMSSAAPPREGNVRNLRGPVFVVHGRDHATMHEVARVIARLTRDEPVILHEKANRGQTLIEKLLTHASTASFAVVLLTGDDLGRAKADPVERPRARQNVILELGLFVGLLGRANVAVLYEEGVEVPSDYDGVVYLPLDSSGAWKLDLAREMKASDVDSDANRL